MQSGTTSIADGVVLAADVAALQNDRRGLARARRLAMAPQVDRTAAPRAPFVVHRLWLDRPVDADRPAFLGTGGLPPLDNISVLEPVRSARPRTGRSARAVRWSNCTRTRSPRTPARSASDLLARLHALYPETADAGIVGEKSLCRNDCPRLAPGDFARPADGGHPARRTGPRRRRHPDRPPGGTDGTRGHHRDGGGQQAA